MVLLFISSVCVFELFVHRIDYSLNLSQDYGIILIKEKNVLSNRP